MKWKKQEIVERPLVWLTIIREVYRRWFFIVYNLFFFIRAASTKSNSKRMRTKIYDEMTHQSHKNLNSIYLVILKQTNNKPSKWNGRNKKEKKTNKIVSQIVRHVKPHWKWCATQTIALFWSVLCLVRRETMPNMNAIRYRIRSFIFYGFFFSTFFRLHSHWNRFFFLLFKPFFSFHFGFGCFYFSSFWFISFKFHDYILSGIFGSIVAFCLFLTLDPCHIQLSHTKSDRRKQKKRNHLSSCNMWRCRWNRMRVKVCRCVLVFVRSCLLLV